MQVNSNFWIDTMLRLWPIPCFVVLNNLFSLSLSFNMLGPANFIFKSFESCETPVEDISVKITQRKYNRTTDSLHIIVETPIEISDGLELELDVSVKKEGGYKPGAFYLKDVLCKVLNTMLGDMFREFLKIAGENDCPLPEGKYDILEFSLNNDNFNVPQLYGEYKCKCTVFKGDQIIGCYNLYLEFAPKTSR